MPRKKLSGAKPWVDPDDAPPLTAEHFVRADVYEGERLVRRGRGRPPLAAAKRQVTVRLDPDLLEQMRATGPGWQTRMNDALRAWLNKRSA